MAGMEFTDEELTSLVPKADFRAVSRLISLVENGSPRARVVQTRLFDLLPKGPSKTQVIGITGAPGAGKSTLVDQLASTFRQQGHRVAIIAVDPTSPFSGGAILGDRIRMVKVSEDAGVFIRSMATRGALGGVSRATFDAVEILRVAGFDYVLVETVGVGQAEVDIARAADTCLVVLVPGMGDAVQAFKAGVLEIADAFVINKADREGVDLVQRDLRLLISLGDYSPEDWKPEIFRTVALNGQGAAEVVNEILRHREWLARSTKGLMRRTQVLRDTLVKSAAESVREQLIRAEAPLIASLADRCLRHEIHFHAAVDLLVQSLVQTSPHPTTEKR